ncbi:MAG: hypothetical protein IKI11_08125 [Neisseriaceae bacterium]|nr:hypothetical protein [Neisseriaceae bacterium]
MHNSKSFNQCLAALRWVVLPHPTTLIVRCVFHSQKITTPLFHNGTTMTIGVFRLPENK